MKARFPQIAGLLAGLLDGVEPQQVGMSHARPLQGKLREMRMQPLAALETARKRLEAMR